MQQYEVDSQRGIFSIPTAISIVFLWPAVAASISEVFEGKRLPAKVLSKAKIRLSLLVELLNAKPRVYPLNINRARLENL